MRIVKDYIALRHLKEIYNSKKIDISYISRFKWVKARDLLYKNPIEIFFKLTTYTGKGSKKINSKFNSISYVFNNQLFTIEINKDF